MRRTFALLMKLYPPDYRELFAGEMAAVFEDSRREERARGGAAYLLFLVAEILGLIRGAVMQRGFHWWRDRPFPRSLSLLAGATLSLTILRPFFEFAGRTLHSPTLRFYTREDELALLAITTIAVVVIAGCSFAFVLNLRSIMRKRISHE